MDTIFETPRLRVRPWRESDAEALFRYASEPEVGERAGWPPHESIEDSIKVIREVFSNGHTFAMELKEAGEAIGCIGYYDHAESNIRIGATKWDSIRFGATTSLTTPLPDGLWRNAASGTPAR